MDANTIESIVNEILFLMKTLNKDKLDTLFLDFRTKNRMLYETILKGEFDREIFKQMMKYKWINNQVLWINNQVLWINNQVLWINNQVLWINNQVLWIKHFNYFNIKFLVAFLIV
jgi:hypothetical protein